MSNKIKTSSVGFSSGAIAVFAAQVAPAGWVLCNGSELDRVANEDLFLIIGESYGVGDGATTYNVPDMRGLFIRGSDSGRGIDAGRLTGSLQDANTAPPITPITTDTNAAHIHGTSHTAGGAHKHLLGSGAVNGGDWAGKYSYGYGGNTTGVTYTLNHPQMTTTTPRTKTEVWAHTHTLTSTVDTKHSHTIDPAAFDAETRPKSVALNYIIKL